MGKQINSLNQWIRENGADFCEKLHLPLLKCDDGTIIAISVGSNTSSNPTRNLGCNDCFDYTQVEVPFIFREGVYIRDNFFDDFEVNYSGKYKFVPVSMIENYVNQHGGYVE